MSAPIKRTLREAHAAFESLVRDVKTLVQVVANDDMPDAYIDTSLQGQFDDVTARRFAEQLVARLLHDEDVALDWIGPEYDDEMGIPERSDRSACEECEDPEDGALLVEPPTAAELQKHLRDRAFEHATTFAAGQIVCDTVTNLRGRVVGRNASKPTMLHVRWFGADAPVWVNAADLLHVPDSKLDSHIVDDIEGA